MQAKRLLLLAIPAVLAACTVNPRPVVVNTPPAVVTAPPPTVVTTPAPAVMGAPGTTTIIEVPAGQYPAPGTCRIWRPGVPAAQQELAGSCADMMNRVPAGAVLLRG
jgi:hypothetical protein